MEEDFEDALKAQFQALVAPAAPCTGDGRRADGDPFVPARMCAYTVVENETLRNQRS